MKPCPHCQKPISPNPRGLRYHEECGVIVAREKKRAWGQKNRNDRNRHERSASTGLNEDWDVSCCFSGGRPDRAKKWLKAWGILTEVKRDGRMKYIDEDELVMEAG